MKSGFKEEEREQKTRRYRSLWASSGHSPAFRGKFTTDGGDEENDVSARGVSRERGYAFSSTPELDPKFERSDVREYFARPSIPLPFTLGALSRRLVTRIISPPRRTPKVLRRALDVLRCLVPTGSIYIGATLLGTKERNSQRTTASERVRADRARSRRSTGQRNIT